MAKNTALRTEIVITGKRFLSQRGVGIFVYLHH